uniref:Nop domain-containing protein n=1 Tax=Molossus molossus TaxID=27622 RepID=A0A7J8IZC9_MOLMO|nr:hypothetical protein HJG59_010318 [Molossus molossus]
MEPLAVADAKLEEVIKEKLNLSCIHSPIVNELMGGICSQIDRLIPGVEPRKIVATCLGLAHSLSHYRLEFSADNVDTVIVQVICDRKNHASAQLPELLPEEVKAKVKEEIAMGTEVSEDICNNLHIYSQVIESSESRTQLYKYLQNRIMANVPHVTVMVGELVGARLTGHAGSFEFGQTFSFYSSDS